MARHIRNPENFTRTLCGGRPTGDDLDYRSAAARPGASLCSSCRRVMAAAEAEGYDPPVDERLVESERLHPVFVYGTLRAGMRNHHWLRGASMLPVGRVTAQACYLMLSVSDSFPGVIRGGNEAVVGEVYMVNTKTLEALDRHEGCPTHYRREAIEVVGVEGACWTYIYQMPTNARCAPSRVVRGADWVAYVAALESLASF